MNKYLPSKKFIYIITSILLVFVIILTTKLLLNLKLDKNESEKVTLSEKQKSEVKKILEIDSDNDGLKDWEEILWKTDPQKTDSDNDGTSDGEEVKDNRDPLKKAPGDEIDIKIIAENKKEDEEFLKLTPTEQFSRVFLSQYIDIKNSSGGKTLSESDKQTILYNMISEMGVTLTDKYAISDLKSLSEKSQTSIRDYGNKFGLIIFEKFSKNAGQELLYTSEAVANQDEKPLEKLNLVIKEYNDTIQALIDLPTPQDNLVTHLAIINNLENMKVSVEGMKKMFSDPLTAIIALQQYNFNANSLFSKLEILQNYFNDRKILFSDNEYGILLFNFKK